MLSPGHSEVGLQGAVRSWSRVGLTVCQGVAETDPVTASGGAWWCVRLWIWGLCLPGPVVSLGSPSATAALTTAASLSEAASLLAFICTPVCTPSRGVCISTGAQEAVFGIPAPSMWTSCSVSGSAFPKSSGGGGGLCSRSSLPRSSLLVLTASPTFPQQ